MGLADARGNALAPLTSTFTVQLGGTLGVTLTRTTLNVGQAGTLTITLPAAAPPGGVTVTLTSGNTGVATLGAASVTIPAGQQTSGAVTVNGVGPGTSTITATAPGFADGSATLTVVPPPPSISSFTPTSGREGASVTITGTNFLQVASVAFNGVSAPGFAVNSSTSITVNVPTGASTGPISVTTTGGTATSTGSFVVLATQDFSLTATPGTATAIQGSQVSYAVSVAAQGGFTGLVTLAVAGVPPGATATFTPPVLSPGQVGTLAVQTAGTTPLGSSTLTVSGSGVTSAGTVSHQQTVTISVVAAGQTALTGRVLDTDSNPVQGVTLTLAGVSTKTDAAGNFLLQNVPAGADQFLFIDGSTAVPDQKFPTFPALVTLVAGQVNQLPVTPFLHPQKATGFVDISNSAVDRVVTDPSIPGLQLTIPAGVTVTGWDGQPNTQVSVRSVPLDRIPLPHPDPPIAARSVYFLYFNKVGGGTPSQPVPVTAPNDLGLNPGDKADLWYYDEGPTPGSATQRWRKAGTATVSADGQTVSTDPGVGLPRFCCGAFCFAAQTTPSLASQSRTPQGISGGDPVDLATGLFVLEKTDLVLPSRLPVVLTRTYRTNDNSQGPFGAGTSAFFTEILLAPSAQSLIYVQPGNTRISFARQPDGTFANTTIPTFQGAKILANADGTRTLRFKDGSTRLFEPTTVGTFQLKAMADRNGNTVTILRDSIGRPVTLVEPSGRQLTITYDPGVITRIRSVRDPIGRTVSYTYDLTNHLAGVTDPAGGVTRYTYDAAGRTLTITDSRGITFLTNTYSASGRVVKQLQADGGQWQFAYMLSGATVTGPGCPGPTCPSVESPDIIAQGFTFTGGFVVATTLTDPRGNAATYRFNNFGYVIEQIDALGQSTKFERAAGTNLLLSTTDPLGRVTRVTYDANGNVTSITDPAGNVRTFTYEPTFNRVTTITDPLGNITRFGYDPINGNLLSITDPVGAFSQIAYNSFGQPVSTTDALGNTTTFAYDAQGDLARITDPLGNPTARGHDQVSRLVSQTDPRGFTTGFSYDALNRLTQVVDALNGLTKFGYDANGNLLTVTDARGNTITHEYDSMDRLSRRIDQLGAPETFAYDGPGNLVSTTDRKSQTTTFAYDAVNRRVQSTFADGTGATFTYDAASRLIKADDTADPHRPAVEQYDALDRLLAETTALGTVSYQHDPLGRRTQMTVSGQAPVAYTYDAASRLRTVTQAPLNPVRIDYDVLGRRTLLILPNAASTEYQYDAASHPTALIYRNAAGLLGDLQYTYDASGNRTTVAGSFASTLVPDAVPSAVYDAANRQLAFAQRTMAYDLNGNLSMLTEGTATTTFTWDARNRLRIVAGAIGGSFDYDSFGRRVGRTTDGVTVGYQFDRRDTAVTTEGGTPIPYGRTPEIDDILYRMEPSGSVFYLADASGSTVALLDTLGNPVTTYTYEPFGRTLSEGAPSGNPFQFSRRENDGSLYFYRARYYSADAFRFISEDPITRALPGGHPYSYVGNNPGSFIDPLGLLEFSTFGGVGIRAVGPGVGGEANIGFRVGTESGGERGAAEAVASARLFPGNGFAAGRGPYAGIAFRDVSELPNLHDVTVDTAIGSVSILFDGRGFAGIQVGGPTPILAIGVGGPAFNYWSWERILGRIEIPPFLFPDRPLLLRTLNPQTGGPPLPGRK